MNNHYTIEQLEELSPQELGEILLYGVANSLYTIQYLQTLIIHGASLDATTDMGWTALHYATRYGRVELIKVLISNGSFINAKTSDRWTPLHYAARYSQTEAIKLLLDAKASRLALNYFYDTPWDLANPYTRESYPQLNPYSNE